MIYFKEHVVILCRNGQVTGFHSPSGLDDNQSRGSFTTVGMARGRCSKRLQPRRRRSGKRDRSGGRHVTRQLRLLMQAQATAKIEEQPLDLELGQFESRPEVEADGNGSQAGYEVESRQPFSKWDGLTPTPRENLPTSYLPATVGRSAENAICWSPRAWLRVSSWARSRG